MIRELHRLTFSAPAQPVFDRLTRRRYREAYRSLMQTQWLSRDEIRTLQLRRLERVLSHAHEYSPFHRERLHAAGWSPGSAVDFDLLRDLPVLEREDLKDRLDDVATISRFKFGHVDTIKSGGTTTGTPIKLYNDGWASDCKGAARLRTNRWAGHLPGERICFFGGATLPPGRRPLYDRVLYSLKGRKTVPHWDVSEPALATAVREITAFRPRLLMCYPSTVSILCSFLKRRGIELRVPAVLLSGETVPDGCRSLTQEVLQLAPNELYGSCELGDAASTCPDCRRLHIQDENVIIETDSSTGSLLATDLTNLATPLIRYRVGDVGRISDEPAACGRGLSTLSGLEGRIVDVIDFRDGGRLSFFSFIVLMGHFPQVSAYQAWQSDAGSLRLLVQGLTPEVEAEMRTRIAANLPPLEVDIVGVDEIPATRAGKRPFFVKGRTYSGQKEIGPE